MQTLQLIDDIFFYISLQIYYIGHKQLKLDSHSAVCVSSDFKNNKTLGLTIYAEGYQVFFKTNQNLRPSIHKTLYY
jgi:hypothetical protein